VDRYPERRRPEAPLRGRARRALVVACLVAAAAVGQAAPPAPGADATTRPATAADCQSLMHQFDVAFTAHHDSPHADGAKKSRDAGDSACQQGHYTDGVHQLRRALHDIGVKPVKIVTVPAPH
jgi:hypothetical protein